jgi:flagellar hook-associated protein 3 FlgL
MRISTMAFHNTAVESMLNQQSILSVTQNQLATGKRISTPADDPIGAVHVVELNRAIAESDQFTRNAGVAEDRLANEEQSVADAGVLLRRVRELVLQANNGVSDSTSLGSIATELKSRAQELMDIANRRDSNGEYLFAGFATTVQPFSSSGPIVNYAGDQGSRQLQTGPNQFVTDSHSGFAAFMNVQQGNGTFVATAGAANTGSGSLGSSAVLNSASWAAAQPNTYTITFTAPNTYQITDSASTVVGGGAFTAGSAIAINGAQIAIDGIPATGDTFTLAPAQKESMFVTLENIVNAVQSATNAPQSQAQLVTQMFNALTQLDQDETHLLNIRAEIGARMSTLDDSQAARENDKIALQSALSDTQDLDYAEAISRMNRQLMGLQAAQSSYSQISHLSLFNYL